jgi:hypothetical protein
MPILLCSVKCQLIFLYPPHASKVGGGGSKNFFSRYARKFCPPHFQNRGAAPEPKGGPEFVHGYSPSRRRLSGGPGVLPPENF